MAKSATVELKVLAEATDAIKDIRKVEGSLDELETAAKAVGQGANGIDQLSTSVEGLQEASEDAAKAGSGLSEAFVAGLAGGGVVEGLSALRDVVTEGFSRIAELASDTFVSALNFNTGRIRLQAQLGLSAEDAKKFGQLSGELYSEAYGESIDQVNEALGLITRTLHLNVNTQRDDLKTLTGDVLNLADVFGIDLEKAVIGVGQLVKTGLAKDAKNATDILTVGLQQAGQDADDLLDTLVEYPTNFRRLGLSGEQAVGLINQSLKAGARNTDQIADSLKEFSLKVGGGAADAAEALKKMGLNAGDIGKQVAGGGDQAREALGRVIEAIKRIEDPLQRTQAIVATFGTPAEDMADAWNALDLNHAVEELGKVEGAAKTLGDTVAGDPTQKWEAFKRSIETNVITFIADNVIPKLEELTPKLQETLRTFATAWEGFKTGFTGEEVTGSITALENMRVSEGPFQEFKEFGETVRRLSDEWLPKLKEALKNVQDQLSELRQFWDDNREAFQLLGFIMQVLALVQIATLLGSLKTLMVGVAGLTFTLGLLQGAINFLKDAWDKNWQDMEDTLGPIVIGIVRWLDDLWDKLKDVWNFVKGPFQGDWKNVFNTIGDAVIGMVRRVSGPLADLLNLLKNVADKLLGVNSNSANTGGRSVAPVGPAVGLMAAPSTTSSPTVINVSVSHTGLGVDSPALQRDLVRTLQRYVQREGPIRVRTTS